MTLNKDPEQLKAYALVVIVLAMFGGSLIMTTVMSGTVTEYRYDVSVTPVDSMDNIDSSEVVEYSKLNDYEQHLVQSAIDDSGADTESDHYETLENDKNVETDNRVVNINGVVSYVNIAESTDEVPDETGQHGFGLFLLAFVVLFCGATALSDTSRHHHI